MNGGRRAGQIKDFVCLYVQRKSDVVPDKFEVLVAVNLGQIEFLARVKIIHTDYVMPLFNKTLTKV